MRKPTFCITAQLISAFVFATHIVQFPFFLNPKFQVSIHLLLLYSPETVFSRRGSYIILAVAFRSKAEHGAVTDKAFVCSYFKTFKLHSRNCRLQCPALGHWSLLYQILTQFGVAFYTVPVMVSNLVIPTSTLAMWDRTSFIPHALTVLKRSRGTKFWFLAVITLYS